MLQTIINVKEISGYDPHMSLIEQALATWTSTRELWELSDLRNFVLSEFVTHIGHAPNDK